MSAATTHHLDGLMMCSSRASRFWPLWNLEFRLPLLFLGDLGDLRFLPEKLRRLRTLFRPRS